MSQEQAGAKQPHGCTRLLPIPARGAGDPRSVVSTDRDEGRYPLPCCSRRLRHAAHPARQRNGPARGGPSSGCGSASGDGRALPGDSGDEHEVKGEVDGFGQQPGEPHPESSSIQEQPARR